MVFGTFMVAWLVAASPMRRPALVKATQEGVARLWRSLAMISTQPFRGLKYPIRQDVVLRSIPITGPKIKRPFKKGVFGALVFEARQD